MWHIAGIIIVNGYASGFAACQLSLTCHLRCTHNFKDDNHPRGNAKAG
ncbi:hypothetical protein T4A_1675 [Trichinella pseudospiralis]|uniref:Uncharacterized protein n=1 Tax=Trichinella pseudospiralis TaxID=6337 RepID=A0A0V1DSE0_TRIPS|nr:hypothetical protein T4A_1675 [Trichinella pseudospiralis]